MQKVLKSNPRLKKKYYYSFRNTQKQKKYLPRIMSLPDDIIQRLRNGDESVLKEIYTNNRVPFLNWIIQKYGCDMEDAKEIFQLSVVTLYDNVVTGKLETLTSSIKTYLFSIGKNKWLEWNRKQGKIQYQKDSLLFDHLEEKETPKVKEDLFLQVEQVLKAMGDPCKKLLELVYFNRLSMHDICKQLHYKNEDSAKNAKYKCLQRLKKQLKISAHSK